MASAYLQKVSLRYSSPQFIRLLLLDKARGRCRFLFKPALVSGLLLVGTFLLEDSFVFAAYILLAVWALKGPKESIQALTFSWLLGFLNPAIFSTGDSYLTMRWGILGTTLLRLFYSLIVKKREIPKEIIYLLLFFFVEAGVSLFFSHSPLISFLKILVFTLGVMSVVLNFLQTAFAKQYWESWFCTLLLVVVLISLPFYFSDLGYSRNGRGFQGILNHPQAYAIFLAPILSWLISLLIFENVRSKIIYLGLFLGLFSLVATQARTGMLAMLGSLILIVTTGVFGHNQWQFIVKQRFGKYKSIALLCFLSIAILPFASSVFESFSEFVKKNPEAEGVFEAIWQSRGNVLGNSWNNFLDNPVTGIGFGLVSNSESISMGEDFLGVPVGASAEKGFFFTAVLEEVGLLGIGLLVPFLFSLTIVRFKRVGLSSFCLFLTCLLINLGEMVFFSFGGMGIYVWLLIGFSRIS
jgi:hypothetical protein